MFVVVVDVCRPMKQYSGVYDKFNILLLLGYYIYDYHYKPIKDII